MRENWQNSCQIFNKFGRKNFTYFSFFFLLSSLSKLFLKFCCPRVDNMCRTHTHTHTRQSMPARLKPSLVSFDKSPFPPSLFLQRFSYTKQWMSSGAHWVFIRFTHVRWFHDEFSATEGNPFSFKFFPLIFCLSFPPVFIQFSPFLPLFWPFFCDIFGDFMKRAKS